MGFIAVNLILDAAVSLLSSDASCNTKIKIIMKIFNYIILYIIYIIILSRYLDIQNMM
jgi:hypothetical protein